MGFCLYELADADMEDYGFEYSDEEPEEQDVDIENQYYNSKGYFLFKFCLISGISSPCYASFCLFIKNVLFVLFSNVFLSRIRKLKDGV